MAIEVSHQPIPTNGTRLHALTAGEGFGVVLLHGFPQSSYEWRYLLPNLAARFRVIAPDLRGMGDSQPDDTGQDRTGAPLRKWSEFYSGGRVYLIVSVRGHAETSEKHRTQSGGCRHATPTDAIRVVYIAHYGCLLCS